MSETIGTLYGYWRSTASWRVRLALALKGVDVEHRSVNLRDGEQHTEEFKGLNGSSSVPVLKLSGGVVLTQSVGIIEYLEEVSPFPELLPVDPLQRAECRAIAQLIAADTHPIQNLRILKDVEALVPGSQDASDYWAKRVIKRGFDALDERIGGRSTPFLFGNRPGYAECFVIPQIYNARRFGLDMQAYPALIALERVCSELPEFVSAHPDQQADKPADQ